MYFKIYFDLEFEKEPADNGPIPSLRIINLPALYDVRSSTSFQRHWPICIMAYYQASQARTMWAQTGQLVSQPDSSLSRHLIYLGTLSMYIAHLPYFIRKFDNGNPVLYQIMNLVYVGI